MLEVYMTVTTVVGYLLMIAASIMAFTSLFDPSSRVGLWSFVVAVILQPGLVALSGLAAIAFSELIDLVITIRADVSSIKLFIDESRQRQQAKK